MEDTTNSSNSRPLISLPANSNHHDLMNVQLLPTKLDGTNYLAWSHFVRLYITGKGRIGYLTGEKKQPDDTDPKFITWVEEDAMLRSWLLQAMTPDISLGYMRLDSEHAIWDAVSQTYYEGGCDAQIYELKPLWQELDYYQPCDMKCSNDTAALKKWIEKERTFELLASLNLDLDQVRIQVLGKDPFPSLREAYAYVHAQALHRSTMVMPPSLEGYSAAVSSGNVAKSSKSDDKDDLKCDYCHQTKHVREHCFKLNGYPPWWPGKKGEKAEGSKRGGGKRSRSSSKAYHTSSSDQNDQPTSQLSSAQMEQIAQECARLLSDKGSKGASISLATSS
ncbi:hypothetical protein PRUPE_6G115900, partial [Prunus persica]